MNTPLKYIVALLLYIPFLVFSQDSIKKNTVNVISMAEGDLNNDGIIDLAIVTQDTLEEYRPYRLQIFLNDSKGVAQVAVNTVKAIDPQYPNGEDGYHSGIGFDKILIDKGSLRIESQLLRGHFAYTFKYRNRQFELTNHTYVSADGLGKIYEIDYNLLTGELVEYISSYVDDEVFKDSNTIRLVDKLPTLSKFEPFSSEFF